MSKPSMEIIAAGKPRASGIRCTRCGDGRAVEREGKYMCTACGWRFGEAIAPRVGVLRRSSKLSPSAHAMLRKLSEIRQALWSGGYLSTLYKADRDIDKLAIDIGKAIKVLERHLVNKLEAPF